MRRILIPAAALILLTGSIVWAATSNGVSVPTRAVEASDSAFAIRNRENFDKMMKVLTHKRCVNCHPADGIPRQGENSHKHYFGIARGKNNVGFDATKCGTCHQDENNDFSGVPGAPEWSLAPHKMRWSGLTRTEIAQSMLDPKRNGNRDHDKVMHHLTEHALVLWAWKPGIDASGKKREKPPIPLEEYKKAVKQWFADGAVIPEK